jgi:hypothetical protein
MGKNPAFLFYPGDWVRDLQAHPLEIGGAWIRLLCQMHSEPDKQLHLTREGYARLWSVSVEEAGRFLTELKERGICSVTCHARSRLVTIKSRRWEKEKKVREQWRLRKQRERMSRESHTPSSKASVSKASTASKKEAALPPTPFPKIEPALPDPGSEQQLYSQTQELKAFVVHKAGGEEWARIEAVEKRHTNLEASERWFGYMRLAEEKEALDGKIKATLKDASIGMLPNGVRFTYKLSARKGYAVLDTEVRTLRRQKAK